MTLRQALVLAVVSSALLFPFVSAGQPAEVTPSAAPTVRDPIEGVWLGTVTSPQGAAALGLRIARQPKGRLIAFEYMPMMHIFGAPVSTVRPDGNEYVLPELATRATLHGDRLQGAFATARLPFELRRVEKFPEEPVDRPDFPTGPEPLWTVSLGAPLWGSPVARAGTIYAAASDGKVHALRARDGATIWSWTGRDALYGEPLVTDEAVYFVTDRSELVKLRRRDGRLLWRVALQTDAAGEGAKAAEDDTYSHRTPVPALAEGLVYVGARDGGFHAVEAKSGRKVFRFGAGAKVCGGAAALGDRVFFGAFDGTVFAIDRRSGAELWRRKTGAAVVSTPLVSKSAVIIGSRDFILYALDPGDGHEVWRLPFWASWIESTPRLEGGVLYVGSSDLRHVRALDPATGNPIWSTDVYGSAWSTPLVVGDVVWMGTVGVKDYLIRHEASLVALDRRTGTILWRRPLEPVPDAPMSGYSGSLALEGGKVFAAGLDGTLSAFAAVSR